MAPPSAGARLESAALAALTVAALALRCWGLGFGLPHRYHPDEYQYVEDGLGFLDGDPAPERLNNPTLHKAFLAAQFALLGRWAERPAGEDDVEALAPFYRLGRWNSALLGAATVPLAWWLGRRAYGRAAGWLSALFLAVSFFPVRESHFATNDASVTALSTLGLAACLALAEGPGARASVGAGLVAGAAAAVKYSGALLAVPIAVGQVVASVARPGPRAARMLLLGLLGAAVAMTAAYLAGNPYTLLDRDLFVEDVLALVGRGQRGYKGQILDPSGGWVFFLRVLARGLGWPLLVLALAGLVRALLRPSRADLVLAAYVLAVYAFHARQLMFFARFLLPAVPALLVLAARLASELVDRFVVTPGRRRLALGALGAALVLPSTVSAVRFDQLLGRADTRDLALAWLEDNLPAGSAVASEPYGPPLDGERHRIETTDSEGLSWHDRTLDHYRDAGFDILITSSFVTERRYADAGQSQRRAEFYARLADEAHLLAEFRPYGGEREPPFEFTQVYGPWNDLFAFDRPGPVIRVYGLVGVGGT